MPDEPVARVHRQRRARDHQRVGGVDQGVRLLHPVFRHVVAEVHDVGLEDAATARTVEVPECRGVLDRRVGVGCHADAADFGAFGEPGIEPLQLDGQRGAGHGVPAAQADDLRVGAVQIHHRLGAGLGVQQVDVLGDDARHQPGPFQGGHGAVAGVGPAGSHVPPPDVIAGPVPLPECRTGQKLLDGHRIARRRVRPAIVRNARIGGDAGAGQHGEPPVGQKIDQFRSLHLIEGRPFTELHHGSVQQSRRGLTPPTGTDSSAWLHARTTPRSRTRRPTPSRCCAWPGVPRRRRRAGGVPRTDPVGYSIEDILLSDTLLESTTEALATIVEASAELLPVLVVGAPLRYRHRIYNTAVVIHRGAILGVVPKSYLPTYREFYESRQIAAGDDVEGPSG